MPSAGFRRCPRCRLTYPATSEYFYARGDGRLEYCLAATATGCHEEYWQGVAVVRRQRRLNATVVVPRSSVPARMAFDVDTRLFGVEIETNSLDRAAIAGALRDAGLAVRDAYASVHDGWCIKSEHCGSELVSPPLRGAAGREEVRKACRALRSVGAVAGWGCGLHVHHDMSDMSVDQFKQLYRNWFDMQSTVSLLVSLSRRASDWCKPVPSTAVTRVNSLSALDRAAVREARLYNIDRYLSMNVQAYSAHGTVEIRLHQGSHDAKKINAWTTFVQAFINASRAGVRMSDWGLVDSPQSRQIDQLIDHLTEYGLPSDRASFLHRRARALNPGMYPSRAVPVASQTGGQS